LVGDNLCLPISSVQAICAQFISEAIIVFFQLSGSMGHNLLRKSMQQCLEQVWTNIFCIERFA